MLHVSKLMYCSDAWPVNWSMTSTGVGVIQAAATRFEIIFLTSMTASM